MSPAELTDLRVDRPVELDVLLREVVDAVTAQLDADRCTLYLVDHARQELVSRVGILPELSEIRLRLGEGVAGRVAAENRPLRASESDSEAKVLRRIDAMTGYTTRSVLAVPVCDSGGLCIAVLQSLNKRQGNFDDADVEKLRGLADGVGKLLERSSLGSQLRPERTQPLGFRYNNIVGESSAMQKVYDRTARAARADVTVLVRGESGTGKELIARAIHEGSPRARGPFVKVDCAALPEALIENELFGHEKGAFTGADRAAEGKVASAKGGTLFLDEIGELSPAMQGKLLRLLQDRTYLRVGGTRPESVDLRFVCATHRDLERAVTAGSFRQDLYYRLRVVEIALPPLRERGGGDLDRLIDHFLWTFCRRHGRPELRLGSETRAMLHAWSWPGNVRELEHCLESAVVLAPGDRITPELLPFVIAPVSQRPAEGEALFRSPVATLREVESAYIRFVVELTQGNRSEAARVLDIGRNTLNRKLSDVASVDPSTDK